MSLPTDWVEYIFSTLKLRFGRDFDMRWEGLDMAVVKADWAAELDGFDRHPHLIEHALKHLPEKPPTVIEFRRIAKGGPDIQPEQQRLPNHGRPASPEFIAAEIQRLQPALRRGPRDPRQWARDLLHRHKTRVHVATPAALAMAQDALREPISFEETQP